MEQNARFRNDKVPNLNADCDLTFGYVRYLLNCTVYIVKNFLLRVLNHTAKTQIWKLETNISRKGIVWPQYQFPHSCVCERFIYSHDRSAYSAAGKYMDRTWEYINCSQTHECGNWDWGRAIPFLGIHKQDFRCSASVRTAKIYETHHELQKGKRRSQYSVDKCQRCLTHFKGFSYDFFCVPHSPPMTFGGLWQKKQPGKWKIRTWKREGSANKKRKYDIRHEKVPGPDQERADDGRWWRKGRKNDEFRYAEEVIRHKIWYPTRQGPRSGPRAPRWRKFKKDEFRNAKFRDCLPHALGDDCVDVRSVVPSHLAAVTHW